jgi:RsiW-degrading membrane proteinase PrsW (M82 family)
VHITGSFRITSGIAITITTLIRFFLPVSARVIPVDIAVSTFFFGMGNTLAVTINTFFSTLAFV